MSTKKIVKRQKSRSECCNFTKKKIFTKKYIYQKYVSKMTENGMNENPENWQCEYDISLADT
jgi:hypothetical protein